MPLQFDLQPGGCPYSFAEWQRQAPTVAQQGGSSPSC